MNTKIYDTLFWIFFVASVIIGLWYIFGDSPTFEQTILFLILTFLFTNNSKITRVSTELNLAKKRFDKLEDSFTRLVHDFKEHIKHR